MKKIIKIIIIIFILALSVYLFSGPFLKNKETENIVNQSPEPIKMCFFYFQRTSEGFNDRFWLKMNILGEEVKGEYMSYPSQKDSKTGTFEGTVGPVNPETMSRRVVAWWDSFAEGMKVKEELVIEFGDGSAVALYGEMFDRGDGVYVYKDKNKLLPGGITLSQIDCDSLDEKINIEKYLRENINSISTKKPVLGGSWYIISVFSDPNSNTGEVIFEDGHIQEKASFSYEVDNIGNFLIKEFIIKQ